MKPINRIDRRQWLGASAALCAMSNLDTDAATISPSRRPRVAAILTEFRFRSHAHVILENFLEPYYFNGKLTDPGVDLVSLYVDQFPDGDMSRDVAKEYGLKIYPDIGKALRMGGKNLAVDGVLSIGEHGRYPVNERGQRMYPRKRFFDEIVNVFRQSKRVVPIFNDKHLSYRWDWADEMMTVARQLKIPFMAGSSVPLAERRPAFELPKNARIDEVVSIHSGGLESYDFHALEALQSIVEARRGGETGVAEVQLLEGDAVWKAAAEGRWDYDLAKAAMQAGEGNDVGKLEDFVEPGSDERYPVHVVLVKYRDGLRATVLRIGHSSTRWNFACRLSGETKPRAASFYVGPWDNRNLFKALAHAIQSHIRDGQSPYPVERTHLVTGILAAAMDSRFEKHAIQKTPHLDIAYQPQDFRAMREMGKSWEIITEDLPEPAGINTGAPRRKG